MRPKIIQNGNFIEVIGHYDNEVQCAKMTLLAELYAIEHREGYAKFKVEDKEKLLSVDKKLKFKPYTGSITVKSNDGSETLFVASGSSHSTIIIHSESIDYSYPDDYSSYSQQTYYFEGYEILGVTDVAGGSTIKYGLETRIDEMDDNNDVYYVVPKQPAGYSITYHANGGTPVPTDLTGQTNLPSQLPTVSKPNFTFDGWYLDSAFITPAVAGAAISANTDLYAKFTRTHITLDLSTIGLPEGTHSIQIKLSDGGVTKADSPLSNAVSYVVRSWEYPVEDGDNLIITQAHTITEDGDYLIIE